MDNKTKAPSHTIRVDETVFRAVYEAPAALPGRHKWLTRDTDVRKIEELLGMPPETIGAPLWVSGDRKRCPKCERETNWLDIVSSALDHVHGREMIARVILGEQKFVNTEAPRAIADLRCFECSTRIETLRSFKCHNWAYAKPALLDVLQEMARAQSTAGPVGGGVDQRTPATARAASSSSVRTKRNK
jgi:hypothetical protein